MIANTYTQPAGGIVTGKDVNMIIVTYNGEPMGEVLGGGDMSVEDIIERLVDLNDKDPYGNDWDYGLFDVYDESDEE